jgi:putative methionine-R-sulfoxide reductase with GAF domain
MSGPSDASRQLPPEILAWANDVLGALVANHSSAHCAVFVFDRARNELVLAGQVAPGDMRSSEVIPGEWTVPLDKSVCGRVYRTGRPALVVDVRLDPDYRTYPGGRTGSELAVPILAGKRVVGVLNCESPFVASFGIDDVERLTQRAAEAGAAFAEQRLGRFLDDQEASVDT